MSEQKRLDEWTETAIRNVLNAGMRHGFTDVQVLLPENCELCAKPVNALRDRIRELSGASQKGDRE